MFAFLRKWTKPNRSVTQKNNPRRASLRVERMEERDVPSVVFSDTFYLDGGATAVRRRWPRP